MKKKTTYNGFFWLKKEKKKEIQICRTDSYKVSSRRQEFRIYV